MYGYLCSLFEAGLLGMSHMIRPMLHDNMQHSQVCVTKQLLRPTLSHAITHPKATPTVTCYSCPEASVDRARSHLPRYLMMVPYMSSPAMITMCKVKHEYIRFGVR